MSGITRMKTSTRLSAINIYNGTVYLAGQTGGDQGDVQEQAKIMLDKVDTLLAEAGSTRNLMLQAVIFLRDMKDFDAFNEIWNAWVPEGQAPARACVEARMARPGNLCEIVVTAALAK